MVDHTPEPPTTRRARRALVPGLAALVLLAATVLAPGTAAQEPEPPSTAPPDTSGSPPSSTPGTAPGTSAAPADGLSADQRSITIDGADVTLWNQDDMRAIDLDADTELPLYLPAAEPFDRDYFLWDAWPVRTWDGQVAEIDGHTVMISLSAPRTPDEGPVFYEVSQWRYWYSDGGEWVAGGPVFDEEPLGSRQWAGSTRYDPETGRIGFYYTAVGDVPGGEPLPHPSELPQGDPAAGRPPVTQQIAVVEADVVADDDGVRFEDFGEHEVVLTADGDVYQTYEDAVTDSVIYGFRDPWAFEDPESGDRFVLFTANAATEPGPHNGVVGVGALTDDGWELRPPIVAAPGVNAQLERPHLVWRDDGVYLFWTTHSFVFSEEGSGPEGLYGMYADGGDWRGTYEPLNDGGLVAGNPPVVPNQTYSYLVLSSGHVMSYLNKAGRSAADDLAGNWVGAPAPMVRLGLDGATTRIEHAMTPLGLGQSDGRPDVPDGPPPSNGDQTPTPDAPPTSQEER